MTITNKPKTPEPKSIQLIVYGESADALREFAKVSLRTPTREVQWLIQQEVQRRAEAVEAAEDAENA